MEGMPAGLAISLDDLRADLARRKLGYERGTCMRFEADELHLVAGRAARACTKTSMRSKLPARNGIGTKNDSREERLCTAAGFLRAAALPQQDHASTLQSMSKQNVVTMGENLIYAVIIDHDVHNQVDYRGKPQEYANPGGESP